jgi:hypothetical protein
MTAIPGQPNHGHADPRSAENTVNDALTPKRRRPITENSDYAAFARRVLRAYSSRVGTGDVEALIHLVALSCDVDDAIQQAINGLRAVGYSWNEIGARLGITRQATQQRWGRSGPRIGQ